MTPSRVTVVVNGQPHELPAGATVADAVAQVAVDARRVAVARNAEVIPRSAWPTTTLREGDRLEVLTAIQGG
jgi:sulfur carrier protein